MALTLYALADQYTRLQEMLAAGEIDEVTFADTMKSLEGDIATKCDNIAAVLRGMELEADAFKFEETRLAERRKSIEANRDRLRRYLLFELQQVNLRTVRGSRFFITVQANPLKVNVLDESKIPPTYWKPSDPTLDKRAILEALKAGQEVPGATATSEDSIRIK